MKRSVVLTLSFLLLLVFISNIRKYINDYQYTVVLYLIDALAMLVCLTILLGKKKIESKIAWVIFILSMPFIGIIFYILLGVEYNRFNKFDSNTEFDDSNSYIEPDDSECINALLDKLNYKKDIADFIYNVNKNRFCIDTKVEVLTNGDNKRERLFKEINKAQKFINVEYFILKEGMFFEQFIDLLIKKAKDGVEVRILMDDFGCVDIRKSTIKKLRDSGIKVAVFNKINFKLLRPSINYRNHRKIIVIDNKIGFTGGINIGDEYIHLDKYYGFWRDTHLILEGSAVADLNLIFLKDWYNSTGEVLDSEKYLVKHTVDNKNSLVQVVEDGPDKSFDVIKSIYFKMINEANKRIWLTTPYLILDNDLIQALKIAALSGVDVRIIVPGLHDKGKKTVYKATEAYFSELLQAGVKIYKYNERFIHSKVFIVDDEIASVGTVNFDYRSFELHFEVTVLLYLDPSIEHLVNDFKNDLKNSTEVVWDIWKNRNPIQKIIESAVRIFSPLL